MERAAAEIDSEARYRPAYDKVGAIAREAGADGFTVLDLLVEAMNPNWRRQPVRGGKLRVRDVRG